MSVHIMPTKHTNFSKSLLGFGSYILDKLKTPQTLDDLWEIYQKDYKSKNYHAKHSFDNLVLTIVFLYSLDAIYEDAGVIYKK